MGVLLTYMYLMMTDEHLVSGGKPEITRRRKDSLSVIRYCLLNVPAGRGGGQSGSGRA